MRYRPEIDGLRTVAVVSVVLYHVGLPGFDGGYLGVDIFFVISGYLIGRIVISETTQGTFRLTHFYERRIRRILPALFLVTAATIPFALFLMSPKALLEYSGSGLSLIPFGSNFWFWRNISYIAEPAALMPLLHTWSLAVEEQFYLFFPPVVMLAHRFIPKLLLPGLITASVVSLVLAHWASGISPSASFYLLPTRAWELLIGSILAYVETKSKRSHSAVVSGLGLSAVLVCIPVFHDGMLHPSVLTLLPILGTAAVIWYSGGNDPASRLLSHPVMVQIGKASYSFYLWHFPVLAFMRLAWPRVSLFELTMGAMLSLALAFASLHLIETPARRQWAIRPLLFWLSAATTGLLLCFATMYMTDGLRFRIPEPLRYFSVSEQRERMEALQDQNMPETFPDNGLPNVWLLGDSHAHHLWNALYLAGATDEVNLIRTRFDDFCVSSITQPEHFEDLARRNKDYLACAEERNRILNSPNLPAADAIVLINYRKPETTPYVQGFAPAMRVHNPAARYIYADRAMIEFDRPVIDIVAGGYLFEQSDRAVTTLADHRLTRNDDVEVIRKAAEADDALFLDIGALECGVNYDRCPVYDTDDDLLYYDQHHWTIEGAQLHGPSIWTALETQLRSDRTEPSIQAAPIH